MFLPLVRKEEITYTTFRLLEMSHAPVQNQETVVISNEKHFGKTNSSTAKSVLLRKRCMMYSQGGEVLLPFVNVKKQFLESLIYRDETKPKRKKYISVHHV